MKRISGFFLVLQTIAISFIAFQNLVNADSSLKLFANGPIYIDADHKVQNLLIRNGSVEAYNVDPYSYKDAEIVDLNGAAAYPGFIDSHIHLLESGYFFRVGADLTGCTNADEIAKALEGKVKSLPDGAPVLGSGISLRDYDKWTLEDLAKIDKVTGSHPAFLGDNLGHNIIINTALMKLAGMSPKTKVPLGGKMGVESGRLTGVLRESAQTLAWSTISKTFSVSDIKAGTLSMAKRWAATGYTGIVDLMGGAGCRYPWPEVFYDLEKEGQLPLRVNYCYTIFDLNDVDDAAKYIGRDTDLVRFVGCKIFVDGAFAGGQAWTSWTNNLGQNGLQEIYTDDIGGPELNLNRIVEKVDDYGMNMHYHAQGDLAIGAVLDALDKVVAKNGKLKGIHTLIHCAFPTDEQIARIKKFNGSVVATMQPGFWPVESNTAYYYGDMADKAYPLKKMADNGISIGFSTDFAVSPLEYSPATMVLGVAVTGGGNPAIHNPVTVRQGIQALSVGSAKTTGKDDIGTLDIGNKADIVIFDRDLYNISPEAFTKDNPKVLATYVSGRKVYEAQKN